MIMRPGQALLLPANPWFIWGSLLLALFSNIVLQVSGAAQWAWTPDLLAIALVFWSVHQPLRINVGAAFALGLFMDVHHGALLGQHALAYAVLGYLAVFIHRRILWFNLRTQALRQGLRRIDAVIFTHSHTDHVAGFDDLRRFCELADRPMPIYASPHTMADLRRAFYYAFDGQHAFRNYVRPEPHEVSEPFALGSVEIIPAEVPHGKMLVYGYIFARGGRKLAAYFSDCHHVPPAVIEQILGIPVLIIDALRHEPHPSHLSLNEALEVAAAAAAQRAFLTHIGHDLGHAETETMLPPHVRLAHDGLRIEI